MAWEVDFQRYCDSGRADNSDGTGFLCADGKICIPTRVQSAKWQWPLTGLAEPRRRQHMAEERFKPISVKPPSSSLLGFKLRSFVDLQLGTIAAHLRPEMALLSGCVLDVGAGESPWREWLPTNCTYRGIDIDNASDYGMTANKPDVTYYDGIKIPFSNAAFDAAICVEVLEHAAAPEELISEIARVLKSGASLLITVPWSARRHHIPYDFHRFTRERLEALLRTHGFEQVVVRERGNDVAAIANKVIILTIRLLKPVRWPDYIWTIPLAMPTGLIAAVMLCAAHISMYLKRGSQDDPLGYFVKAIRR
jgi:SAM-dependent methyltransferase